MLGSKTKKFVEVEIYSDPEDLSEVGVIIRSGDGSDLTAQEILDAVGDALITDSNVPCDIEPVGDFDA